MHPTVLFFELGYLFNILGIAILVLHIRTKKHIEAIKKYGITEFHRKTFGICKWGTKVPHSPSY
jgi:hypothetical protein